MRCQWGRELRTPRSAMGFAKENTGLSEHLKRPNKQRRQIIPWGWNHSLRKRLMNEGVDPATLPSVEELQFIRTHSRRECALDMLMIEMRRHSYLPMTMQCLSHLCPAVERESVLSGKGFLKAQKHTFQQQGYRRHYCRIYLTGYAHFCPCDFSLANPETS